jgi:hypothetical protein
VAAFKDKARSYLGGGGYQLGEEFMDKMASYLMREQKDVDKMYNDLLADKLHVAIKESVQIKRIPIPEEDFKKKMAEIRGSTDLEGYDEEE